MKEKSPHPSLFQFSFQFSWASGLWAMAALAPLFTILYSYLLGAWDWGLMDDLTILGMGDGVIERIVSYVKSLIAFGHFQVFFAVHSGFFYTLFSDSPVGFYIFKAIEIVVIFCIWGFACYRLTRSTLAILLLPVVTLSFHYFYDAFFYLSSHEYLGLFFLGLVLHCCISDLQGLLKQDCRGGSWVPFGCALIFLFSAFCSKEPFVSSGFAVGGAYCVFAFMQKKNPLRRFICIRGLILLFFSAGFTLFLLKFIQSEYTASYNPSNVTKITTNFIAWVKKDFLNHLPWILGAAVIAWRSRESPPDFQRAWSMVLALFLYVGYVAILLPWNTQAYYATPLGLFFAFFITNWISQSLEAERKEIHIVYVLIALAMNQLVCQYALNREGTYQSDTRLLLEWVRENKAQLKDQSRFSIFSNAMEPAVSIPMLVKHKWGMQLDRFRWTSSPEQKAENGKEVYFLYGSRFHFVDKALFENWGIVFYTKNWVLYKKR